MKFFNLILLCYFVQRVHAQTLICQVNGTVVSCPPPVVCPGANVTFTSTAQNLVGSNIWVLPTGTCSGSATPDSILLNQIAGGCIGPAMTCGPYTATNANTNASNPCLTSTLSVTVTSSMTSSVIMAGTRSLAGQNTIVNTTQIMIIAPPGPPNVMVKKIGPDMVQVVVSPSPNGGLPTSYNVTISNSSYTSSSMVMANGSAMVNFTGLRSDSTYNISVVAINCAGNTSTQSYISWLASSPSPQTTSSVPLSSSTPTLPSPAPDAVASAIGPIVGGVVGGVIFIVIVIIIIIILIVFIVLKKPKCEAHDGVPLKTKNSPTPATPTSVGRDTPPPRPSRDTPSPPPGPNTEAEYSTVDASKKPQNQGMVYAEVGIRPPASSQQRKPAPNPSSQQVYYGEVRAQ